MINQGHQHDLLHLYPQVDISTIQVVGYQTTREEIRDLYHQVYKLRRLPESLLCGPEQVHELTRDVMSSLKSHLRQRGDKQPRGCEEPEPTDTHLPQDKTSQRMRWGTLAKRELAEAREAHQWALAATTALEERIERLSQSTTRSRTDAHIPSQSCNCWRKRSQGQSRRHCRALPEDSPFSSPTHSPLSGAQRHWRTRRLNQPSWSSTTGPHHSWDWMLSISSRSKPPCKRKT